MPSNVGGGRTSLGLIASLFLTFVAAAALATQPLSAQLSTRLPANADALWGAWVLRQVCDSLPNPQALMRGPMFHPDSASLFYADPLIGIGLQSLPLCVAGLDHVALYNASYVLLLAMSALGAWLLAREITGSASASVVAASVFAFTSANYDSAARIQIVASQWTPFCLLYLIRFCRGGRLKDATLLGGAFALQALSSGYFELFLAVLLVLAIPFWIELSGGPAETVKRLPGVALAVALSAVVVLPINLAQRSHLDAVMAVRPQAQQITRSFFTEVLPTNLIYGGVLGRARVAYDALYFPGFVPVGLSVLFLIWALRNRRERVVLPIGLKPLIFVGVAAFVFAFGAQVSTPWGDIPGPLALFSPVPGLGQARVPSRFLMFSRLALALTAAAGAHLVIAFGKPGRMEWVRAVAIALVCFAEHWSAPLDTWVVPTKAQLPKVYGWIERARPSLGPILEFPPALQRLRRDEAAWLHTGAFHKIPMANGFSSFRPAWHEFVMEAALRWPDERLLSILDQMGVRTIIVHPRPRGLPEVDQAVTALLDFAQRHPEQLRMVESFSDPGRLDGLWSRLGDEKVFAVLPAAPIDQPKAPAPLIERHGWSCRSSEPGCERAIDGDLATLLLGRDAAAGQFLRVIFPQPARIQAVSIGLGRFSEGFPREPIIRLRREGEWVATQAELDIRAMLADMVAGSKNPIMMYRFPETMASGFEIRLRPDDRRFRALSVPEVNAYGTTMAPAAPATFEPSPETRTR